MRTMWIKYIKNMEENFIYIYIYIYLLTHTHTHTHTYIYIYIYIFDLLTYCTFSKYKKTHSALLHSSVLLLERSVSSVQLTINYAIHSHNFRSVSTKEGLH